MTFSTLTDIMTMMFCSAVLIQSVRLIRILRTMKGAAFGEMVAALDISTNQAKAVLGDLRETLRVDCAANARVIANGTAMREELVVMAGIADAVAERIVDAVGKSNARPAALSASALKRKVRPQSSAKPDVKTQPKTKLAPPPVVTAGSAPVAKRRSPPPPTPAPTRSPRRAAVPPPEIKPASKASRASAPSPRPATAAAEIKPAPKATPEAEMAPAAKTKSPAQPRPAPTRALKPATKPRPKPIRTTRQARAWSAAGTAA